MKTSKKPSFSRPKFGETYYSVEMEGAAYWRKRTYHETPSVDAVRLRIGNFFRTRDEAKAFAVWLNKLLKSRKNKTKSNNFFKIKK